MVDVTKVRTRIEGVTWSHIKKLAVGDIDEEAVVTKKIWFQEEYRLNKLYTHLFYDKKKTKTLKGVGLS